MIYFFNPDNDLALANFGANYTPPASALKMAEDLAMLPLWYAADGSKILSKKRPDDLQYYLWFKYTFSATFSFLKFDQLPYFPSEEVSPWGWNPALRNRLLAAGMNAKILPDAAYLELLRDYSNRKHAVTMLRDPLAGSDRFCGESHFFTTAEDVLDFLNARPGDKILKMPNSGSGKGLVWVLRAITDKQTDWVKRVLKTQGGIVAEPVWNKVQDFAMEFRMSNSAISFAGFSLFSSASSGAYSGNALMSNEAIETLLSGCVGKNVLGQLKNSLMDKLPAYFPGYTGYLGVDMMICHTAEGYSIHPCVEINMRMNMGMVSRIFFNRFVDKDSHGDFRIEYFKEEAGALLFVERQKKKKPLLVKDHRIVSGFMALHPVNSSTRYLAYAELKKR